MENRNYDGKARMEELFSSLSNEPAKMSVEALMTIHRQTGTNQFVECLAAGRWVLDTEESSEVVYSHEVFKDLLKEVSTIENEDLRTSLFEKLMRYKSIKQYKV